MRIWSILLVMCVVMGSIAGVSYFQTDEGSVTRSSFVYQPVLSTIDPLLAAHIGPVEPRVTDDIVCSITGGGSVTFMWWIKSNPYDDWVSIRNYTASGSDTLSSSYTGVLDHVRCQARVGDRVGGYATTTIQSHQDVLGTIRKEWYVPFGMLNGSLDRIHTTSFPSSRVIVQNREVFDVVFGVHCLYGECGPLRATLRDASSTMIGSSIPSATFGLFVHTFNPQDSDNRFSGTVCDFDLRDHPLYPSCSLVWEMDARGLSHTVFDFSSLFEPTRFVQDVDSLELFGELEIDVMCPVENISITQPTSPLIEGESYALELRAIDVLSGVQNIYTSNITLLNSSDDSVLGVVGTSVTALSPGSASLAGVLFNNDVCTFSSDVFIVDPQAFNCPIYDETTFSFVDTSSLVVGEHRMLSIQGVNRTSGLLETISLSVAFVSEDASVVSISGTQASGVAIGSTRVNATIVGYPGCTALLDVAVSSLVCPVENITVHAPLNPLHLSSSYTFAVRYINASTPIVTMENIDITFIHSSNTSVVDAYRGGEGYAQIRPIGLGTSRVSGVLFNNDACSFEYDYLVECPPLTIRTDLTRNQNARLEVDIDYGSGPINIASNDSIVVTTNNPSVVSVIADGNRFNLTNDGTTGSATVTVSLFDYPQCSVSRIYSISSGPPPPTCPVSDITIIAPDSPLEIGNSSLVRVTARDGGVLGEYTTNITSLMSGNPAVVGVDFPNITGVSAGSTTITGRLFNDPNCEFSQTFAVVDSVVSCPTLTIDSPSLSFEGHQGRLVVRADGSDISHRDNITVMSSTPLVVGVVDDGDYFNLSANSVGNSIITVNWTTDPSCSVSRSYTIDIVPVPSCPYDSYTISPVNQTTLITDNTYSWSITGHISGGGSVSYNVSNITSLSVSNMNYNISLSTITPHSDQTSGSLTGTLNSHPQCHIVADYTLQPPAATPITGVHGKIDCPGGRIALVDIIVWHEGRPLTLKIVTCRKND